MLFASKHSGMEIGLNGVTCALTGGSATAPRVRQVSHVAWQPETITLSLREPNIRNADAFVTAVRSAHEQLQCRSKMVAVSLPDGASRIILFDLDGRFKSRSEAVDLIRWKLKKNIPFDPADTMVDYQQLTVRENGDLALMVAIASRAVITQYEDLIAAAGLVPSRIDCNSLNIFRLFDKRLSLQQESILVSFYAGTLTVTMFVEGIPEFFRSKDLSGCGATDSRVYREISSSLLVYRERFPERQPHTLFCIAPPDVMEDFLVMTAEATGLSPLPLEIKGVVVPGNQAPGDQKRLFFWSAAIGAAKGGN